MSGAGTRPRLWLAAALALVALKLWLTRGQGVFAIGGAAHDDRLFLELAQQLVRGEWLGPYNELTLAKGPFYPLFIAAAFCAGVPLFAAQHLFYAMACGVFARALRPAVPAPGVRFAVFAFLLWNPMTFDAPAMGRVLRQHVYGPLALIVVAGLVALYLRRAESPRRQAGWAAGAGLAAGAFYLTREETVWLGPTVLLLATACVIGVGRAAAARAAAILGVGLAAAALPILAVCALNRHHYGWFGTCELRAPEFRAAYGAMLRVRVGPERPYVPVSREAREAMAAASPRFAEVQRQFDVGVAPAWAAASAALTGLPPEQGQIGGGWMVWALREATARAGHHPNARHALAFYRALARELDAAADQGRLPAGPPRRGFLPAWRDEQGGPFIRTAGDFASFVVRFSRFSAHPPPSEGSDAELQLFRDLTRERLSPRTGELDVVGAARYLLNAWKVEVLQLTGKVLRQVLFALFCAALALAALRLAWVAFRGGGTYALTVAAAAGGACIASVLIHAMIEVTSFPVLTISSFAPVYPLLLVFIVASFADAAAAWRGRSAAPAAVAGPPVDPAPAAVPPAAWRAVLLAGIAALLPFVAWQREFAKLFWFADDFLLLDQLAQMGMWEWTTVAFAENFVPLFKLLWGGAVMASDGSYRAMLWLLWLTHVLNTWLLGRLLLRAGFAWPAALFTQAVFGLTPANLETLGWSVQWSAMLATAFLLLALDWRERLRAAPDRAAGGFWRLEAPLAALAAASACSFSRGVVTGAVLGLSLLLPALLRRDFRALRPHLRGAGLCLLPAVAVAVLIKLGSAGNHQQLLGSWREVAEFSAAYFLLNPVYALLGGTSLHPAALVLLAAAKLGVMLAALRLARGSARQLLLVLLAYDLGSALLVGIGRHHTGFLAALSPRYQYGSLLAWLPFLAVLLEAAQARLPAARWRPWAAAAILAVVAAASLRRWPAELAGFTPWRGTGMRELLAAPATTDPDARVPALEFMHVERAKALQRAYGLH